MKKIVIACVISSVVALGIAGGAGWGIYHSMNKRTTAAAEVPAHEAEDSQDESSSIFVSLPETVVTLHDDEGSDRYMVAELVMVVDSEKDAEKIKKDEPLYQSITVDELSNMKYEDIRALKISDMLFTAYVAQFWMSCAVSTGGLASYGKNTIRLKI